MLRGNEEPGLGLVLGLGLGRLRMGNGLRRLSFFGVLGASRAVDGDDPAMVFRRGS